MMDISDGLSSELMHICTQSNVGCSIYEDKLPIDYQAAALAEEMNLNIVTCALNGGEDYELLPRIPKDTVIYELMGPMFFAGLDTFHKIVIPVSAKCLILEMHSVPALDNAGVQALDNLYKRCGSMGVQLILSDVHAQPNKVLGKYGLSELLGEENICSNLSLAIERAYVLTEE